MFYCRGSTKDDVSSSNLVTVKFTMAVPEQITPIHANFFLDDWVYMKNFVAILTMGITLQATVFYNLYYDFYRTF